MRLHESFKWRKHTGPVASKKYSKMWESKALDRDLGNGDRQCHQLYHFQLAMYHLAVGTVLARRDSLVQLCQGFKGWTSHGGKDEAKRFLRYIAADAENISL